MWLILSWFFGVAHAACDDFDNSLSGSDSLSEAIGCLSAWGTDTITVESGWSGSDSSVTVSTRVVIQGEDESDLVELPQIDVTSSGELTLNNVAFRSDGNIASVIGYVYGVHVQSGGTLDGTNISATVAGAVPIWVDGGEASITNLSGVGGTGRDFNVPAVLVQTGSLTLIGDDSEPGTCSLTGFVESGAVLALGAQEVMISGCEFADNTATDDYFFETGILGDGYPYAADVEVWGAAANAQVSITDSTFSGSHSEYHAGSMLFVDVDATLSNNTFSDTMADGTGGAVLMLSDIGAGSSLVLSDNTFTGTSANVGGALYVQQATLTGSGDRFEQVSAITDGGVLLLVLADAVLSDWEMDDVEAPEGAAVYVSGYYPTTLELDGTFSEVHSTHGALFVEGPEAQATVSGTWTDVVATSSGGLMAVHDGGTGILEGVVLDNSGAGESGAYAGVVKVADGDSAATVDGGTFEAIASSVGGGFASVTGGSLEVVDATIQGASGEQTGSGGAFYIDGGELLLQNSTIGGFSAADQGGALFLYEASAVLQDVTLESSDSALGGGIFAASSSLSVDGTDLLDLEATNGGGIYLVDSTMDLTRSYFCDTRASGYAAGIYVANSNGEGVLVDGVAMQMLAASAGGANLFAGGEVVWTNTTIIESTGSALLANTGAELVVLNTLLSGAVVGISSTGGTTGSYNLFDEVDTLTDGSDDVEGTGSLVEDPQLTAFVPGACTKDNLVPAAGSPVIDAGDPAISDPDGSRSDIGAFGGPSSLGTVDPGDDTGVDTASPDDTGDGPPIDRVDLRGGCSGCTGGSADTGLAGVFILLLGAAARRRQGSVARKPS